MREIISCLHADGKMQARGNMMEEKEKGRLSGAMFLNIEKGWDLVNKWRV